MSLENIYNHQKPPFSKYLYLDITYDNHSFSEVGYEDMLYALLYAKCLSIVMAWTLILAWTIRYVHTYY